MHARAAYIRSFGTTGILLVASLLMLALVGAVVGFHRWPGGTVVQNVPSVPLKPASTSHLREVRSASASLAGVHKTTSPGTAHRASAPKSTAGLVKVAPVRSPEAVGYPVAISPGQVGSTPPTPQSSSGGGNTAPQQPPAPPPPSAPQPLQQLVDEIIQSVPPPPQHGQPMQIHLPLAGVPTISTPPLP